MAEQGFHAVSIEAVARGAGITRPIVYHHFDGARRPARRPRRAGDDARARAARVDGARGEGLVASFAAYLAAVEADPVTWRLVLMPPEGLPDGCASRRSNGGPASPPPIEVPGSPDPELTGLSLQALADEGARLLLAGYDRERILAHAAWVLSALGG